MPGLQTRYIQLQMKNKRWHITPIYYSFNKNQAKMKKQSDIISLSHHCGGILAHSSVDHCFRSLRFAESVYAQLDINWVIAEAWFFSFFSHSVVDVRASFGLSLCCKTRYQTNFSCQTTGNTFDPKRLWYTEGFNDYRVSWSWGCKHAHHHVSQTVWGAWDEDMLRLVFDKSGFVH